MKKPQSQSLLDFPAPTSVMPTVEVQVSLVSALDYGRKRAELLARYDQDTQSWRTSQRCLVEGWTVLREIFPRSGMTVSGIALELSPLVPLTAETGYGAYASKDLNLFPTPDASPHKYRLQGDSQQSRSLMGISGGKLNPEWTEWMMGYPEGWTALPD